MIAKYIEKMLDNLPMSKKGGLGPVVCMACEISYTRDKWSWYCPLCKNEHSTVFWRDLSVKRKEKVDENDKFYTFMNMKHARRHE